MNSVAGEPHEQALGDHELIHIPGAILPHGAMLVIDAETFEILQAAGATAALLGVSANALLGTNLALLFWPRQLRRLRIGCDRYGPLKPRHLFALELKAEKCGPLDASIHCSDGFLVLEFESAQPADPRSIYPLLCVQQMMEGLDKRTSMQAFCQLAVEHVRSVSGYDRVMIYRFLEDDSCWVFAESRAERLDPFLDLLYPAADISQQARALYLKSNVRLLGHVDYEPSPLIPLLNPRTHQPLDMSQAILRDVSLLHRKYLRGMGVDAAMSISIITDGKLWGLITCHHYRPHKSSRYLRPVYEIFGSLFSLQLDAHQRADLLDAQLAKRQVLRRLMRDLATGHDYAEGLVRELPALLDYMTGSPSGSGSDSATGCERQGGIAVRVNNHIFVYGTTPCTGDIEALTEWLVGQIKDGDGVFMTDRLGELWEPAKAFAAVGAGLLVATVSRASRDFILWFRPEHITAPCWDGGPGEPIEIRQPEERLNTLKSLELPHVTGRGRSRPWRASDRKAGLDLHASLLEVFIRFIEEAAREQEKAHAQELLLMIELDHRVKSTLANTQALVLQCSRSTSLLKGFTQSLDQRIHAMDKAHSLLTENRWEGVSMGDLLHKELDAHSQEAGRVTLSGPDILLTPKAALAMSLAINELGMNAVKHGSLSLAGGRITVRWRMAKAGGVDVSWLEADGPLVEPLQQTGFGSNLIEQALAMETGAHSILKFDRSGVACNIFLPTSSIARIKSMSADTPRWEAHANGRH